MKISNLVELLVVEDNPADSDLIREYLSEIKEFSSNLICVSTLKDAKDFLKVNSVHVVLVDLSLPDSRGLDTIQSVIDFVKTAPAIVLTSLDDNGLALKAIESGAQDYLLKGNLNADVLARVIRYSLQRRKWMTRLDEVQSQFYTSQKMDSIGRMASGVAHDFNNQLGTISLLSALVEESVGEGHLATPYIKKIQEATVRASDLVKKLLIYSRQNTSKPEVFDLYKLIKENETLFRKLVGASVKVEILGAEGAFIYADPGLIDQAVTNLVINARDAMSNGGTLTLKITLANGSDNKMSVLTVTDTGCGIPEELQEKIFEPFFTTKEKGKGTGLGLSMVYGAVTQSSGSITIKSAKAGGTTFILYFPFSISEEKSASELKSHSLSTKGQGQTILVVDDEPYLREAIEQHLLLYGYNPIGASNGIEALEKIKSMPLLDLLITDMVMPEMGGKELVEKLKQSHPDLKVIFISGYSADMHWVGESENAMFLEKPFSHVEMQKKISQLLNGK